MKDFCGGSATVEETNETIGQMYDEHRYLMDTHTAVAYKVYKDYVEKTGDETPTLIDVNGQCIQIRRKRGTGHRTCKGRQRLRIRKGS